MLKKMGVSGIDGLVKMPPKMIILIVWLMRVKEKLDDLGLVEDEDYRLEDILQPVPQGGYSTKKVYILTPEAFKTCLMRARKYPNQKVDPVIYSKYYLLLEKQVLEHFVEHYLEEILQFIYLIFKNKLFLKKFISKLLKV
jgi:hypothetical protein